ncbi:PDR/VanB family oxidoreductase [Agromyces bracchium]|nr:PDR/VanB family oxidoreductase [Agromyces bracchium]
MTPSISMTVVDRSEAAAGIAVLRLRPADGAPTPVWAAGDHVDVGTPYGLRQYSLCGRPDDGAWTIAVRRDAGGRGGSRWLHETARIGVRIDLGAPRSTFPFRSAPRYAFIAGGIGITAVLSMLDRASADGADWTLLYTVRDADGHALADHLPADPRVTLWSSARDGRVDVGEVLDANPDAAIYCCGPAGLIDDVREAAAARGRAASVTIERFEAIDRRTTEVAVDRPFDLHLARTGRTLLVPADRSALDALGDAGVFVPSSCREGICGSCELPVLAGEVDHRDSVLDDAERAEHACFFPCVSRAHGRALTIDA